MVSMIGASRPPWNTASAAVWLISAAVDGESEACAAAESGGIVQPIANHQHLAACPFQIFEPCDFLMRFFGGGPMRNACLLSDRLDSFGAIAGKHLNF